LPDRASMTRSLTLAKASRPAQGALKLREMALSLARRDFAEDWNPSPPATRSYQARDQRQR